MDLLLVDDSMAATRRLAGILTGLGHTVVGHAENGARAVALVKELTPDGVFLDIVMPDMDGLTALRAIRAIDKRLPVFVLSSAAAVGDNLERAIQLGASAVLSKPVSSEAVRNALVEHAEEL